MPFTPDSIMPIGKHKDKKLSQVPDSYLMWLAGKIESCAPNKRTLAEKLILEYVKNKNKP